MKKNIVLSLKDVNYRYRDAAKGDYVLKNINYDFEAGKGYRYPGGHDGRQ